MEEIQKKKKKRKRSSTFAIIKYRIAFLADRDMSSIVYERIYNPKDDVLDSNILSEATAKRLIKKHKMSVVYSGVDMCVYEAEDCPFHNTFKGYYTSPDLI